jgi:hypothetical protein
LRTGKPPGEPKTARPTWYYSALFNFTPTLFPVPLSGKSRLNPFFFAWLQIERMALDFFNDVFLLHFPFEAPEGVFQCFAILEPYFRQLKYTPQPNRVLPPGSSLAFEQ